jgi:hypothetical protein
LAGKFGVLALAIGRPPLSPIRPNKINSPIRLDRNRSGNQGRRRRSQRMKSENLSNQSASLLMVPLVLYFPFCLESTNGASRVNWMKIERQFLKWGKLG